MTDPLPHIAVAVNEVHVNLRQEARIRAARALVYEALAYVTKEARGYRFLTRAQNALDRYIASCVETQRLDAKPWPTDDTPRA